MLGFYAVASVVVSGSVQASGSVSASAISRGAGSSARYTRRRPERWEVEYDGEIIAFPSAESAHAWLLQKITDAKKEAKKPVLARKQVEKPAKPVIRYEGVDVSRWQYYNKPIAKQIETGAHLKQLERWIQARLDDDDDEEAMAVVM